MNDEMQRLDSLQAKYGWLCRLKPRFVADPICRVLGLEGCRTLATLSDGTRLYIDPFSDLGVRLLRTGVYEPSTVAVFKELVRAGYTVVDIGANEGYFSVLAGALVGPTGNVIAVEPQKRLADIIEINLRVNKITWATVVPKAVGGKTGDLRTLHLYSRMNTGMSSMVRKYHSSIRSEVVEFIAFDDLMRAESISHIDFAKIDVEGFEQEVVANLLPLITAGRVKTLFLDYHARLLAERRVDPLSIHHALLKSGMHTRANKSNDLSGYVLYQFVGSSVADGHEVVEPAEPDKAEAI
jgi:FkbM family methyltransferase